MELLKKEDMNIHERLCVQLRMCEKQILKATQAYAAERKTAVNKGDNSDTTAA